MLQENTKRAYVKIAYSTKDGKMSEAVRTAIDADINMYTLLELREMAEFEGGIKVPLKDLAILGMYIEVEKARRKDSYRVGFANTAVA